MKDLLELNRRISEHWLGRLDILQETYLGYVPICLGQLACSAAELAKVLASSNENPLPVARLNRRYLRFARLSAKEVAAGRPEMLITLGIDLEHAELLRNLTDDEVDRLAFGWNGPIMQFASQAFKQGAALHERAAMHHATALIAARPARASMGRT